MLSLEWHYHVCEVIIIDNASNIATKFLSSNKKFQLLENIFTKTKNFTC